MPSQESPEKKSRFKRTPKDPSKPGRLSQFTQLYQQSVKHNPKIPWWMLLAFVVGYGLVMLVNLAWFHPIYLSVVGIFVGVLCAVIVFGRLAERAAYGSLEGQPGATAAVLGSLRRGWLVEQEPVATDSGRARSMKEMGQAGMVFRAVGKPGVVLIGEGPKGSAAKLLESERKRVARVTGPEVPIHLLRVGAGDDATPVGKLTGVLNKLDKKLTDSEVQAVTKRLRALGGAKPPIPKGMDPRNAPKVDRKAMRGR